MIFLDGTHGVYGASGRLFENTIPWAGVWFIIFLFIESLLAFVPKLLMT